MESQDVTELLKKYTPVYENLVKDFQEEQNDDIDFDLKEEKIDTLKDVLYFLKEIRGKEFYFYEDFKNALDRVINAKIYKEYIQEVRKLNLLTDYFDFKNY